MGTTSRIVTTLAAAIVLAVVLRLVLGPAMVAPYASAKLGVAADPFAVSIEMAVSDDPKAHLAD